MANKFETFRDTIKATIATTCIKESADKSRIAYTWSMEHVFNECGEACKFEDLTKLPGEFKDIVRFEFNQLKESVLSGKDWTHKRSTKSYALSDGDIELRRSDLYANSNVSLSDQLTGAIVLLGKVDKALTKISSTNRSATEQVKFTRLSKRQRNLNRLIDWIRGEIEAQDKLLQEVAANNGTTVEQAKAALVETPA